MHVKRSQWNLIEDNFLEEEKRILTRCIIEESIVPKGWFVDEDKLKLLAPELLKKLQKEVNQ